jgi:TolB-like protein/tetratricopeptide (TPR) repeat protein
MASILAFGPFQLDPGSGQLRKHGRKVRLPPQPFRVLALLTARAGDVVTQEELRREVWGERTFVEFELGLYYCLRRIRAVLGDDGHAPRYIETLPRCGYRFMMAVERLAPPDGVSVAVLPFDNLNRREEFEYFADGVTDALITELGMQPGLRVISRQSVLRFRRSERALADIGRSLGVDHLVEGAVLHDGGRVRVSAQLVRATPEKHLWARSVEVETGDVIALQRGVVHDLVREMTAVLAPGAAVRAPGSITSSSAAFEKFLKSRHYSLRWTAEGFRTGIAMLTEAIALDPTYATARAELADTLSLLGFWGHVPLAEAMPRARQLALEAIRLDDGLSRAHCALSGVLWLLDWNVAGAEREAERAVALNANDIDALIHRGVLRAVLRRDRQGAHEDALRALRVDPLAMNAMTWATWILVFIRKFDEAAALARRTLEVFPDSVQPRWALGVVHQAQGRPVEAREAWESALRVSNEPVPRSGLAAAAASLGDRQTAVEMLDSILAERRAGSRVSLTRPLVTVWIALGDMDAAYAELDAALEARDPVTFFIPITAMFDPLRADPRFPVLMRRFRRAVRRAVVATPSVT